VLRKSPPLALPETSASLLPPQVCCSPQSFSSNVTFTGLFFFFTLCRKISGLENPLRHFGIGIVGMTVPSQEEGMPAWQVVRPLLFRFFADFAYSGCVLVQSLSFLEYSPRLGHSLTIPLLRSRFFYFFFSTTGPLRPPPCLSPSLPPIRRPPAQNPSF